MAVFRIHKNNNYVTMGKTHLKEKDMSLKAIGLLSVMLSLPDSWDYSINGLTAIRCESRNTINGILKELEKFGYLERKQLRDTNGIITGYEYNIYEKPDLKKEPYPKNPYPKNRDMENRDMENCIQLKNKELNNKQLKHLNNKYFDDEELNELFKDYLELRKKIKAVNSDRAIKGLLTKLEPYPDNIKKEMIEESIINSWKSIYPLKEEKQTAKSRNQEQWKVLEDIYNGNIKID